MFLYFSVIGNILQWCPWIVYRNVQDFFTLATGGQVAVLKCAMAFREFKLMIEQPKNSAMYSLPELKELVELRLMQRYLTYMGYWVAWKKEGSRLCFCSICFAVLQDNS